MVLGSEKLENAVQWVSDGGVPSCYHHWVEGSPTNLTLHSALRKNEMLAVNSMGPGPSTQQVLNEEQYLPSLLSTLCLMAPATSLPLGSPDLSRL